MKAHHLNWGWLALETLALIAAAPGLLFPDRSIAATLVALGSITLIWVTAFVRRMPLVVTPLNGAMLVWSVMVGVGIAVTSYPARTLSKATGLLLALAVWRYLVLAIDSPQRLRWAVWSLGGLSLGIVALGVLGMRWSDKISYIQPLIDRLPQQLVHLPEAPAQGINANQVAGVLASLLPLAAGIVALQRSSPDRSCCARAVRPAGMIITALLLVLLLATQSRSGWAGTVAGILALICVAAWTHPASSWRRVGWVTLAGTLLAAILGYLWIGQATIAAMLNTSQGVITELGVVSLAGRVEIWARALYAIQDFPLTGCGLGSFREVVWVLYPLFRVPPGQDFAHAHNIFLQIALDVGLPGLAAYIALLSLAGITGSQVALLTALRAPNVRALAIALIGMLVGFHAYGLTDALAPGSRPAIIYWIALGLLSALARLYLIESQLTSGSSTANV